jgi:hypothetical protein
MNRPCQLLITICNNSWLITVNQAGVVVLCALRPLTKFHCSTASSLTRCQSCCGIWIQPNHSLITNIHPHPQHHQHPVLNILITNRFPSLGAVRRHRHLVMPQIRKSQILVIHRHHSSQYRCSDDIQTSCPPTILMLTVMHLLLLLLIEGQPRD